MWMLNIVVIVAAVIALAWLMGDNLLSPKEREFVRRLRERPQLSDLELYRAFYQDSGIPEHLPGKLREVFEDAFGMDLDGIRPEDNLYVANTEVDWGDIVFRVKCVFGVVLTSEDLAGLDGTFDSLVKLVARKAAAFPARSGAV